MYLWLCYDYLNYVQSAELIFDIYKKEKEKRNNKKTGLIVSSLSIVYCNATMWVMLTDKTSRENNRMVW